MVKLWISLYGKSMGINISFHKSYQTSIYTQNSSWFISREKSGIPGISYYWASGMVRNISINCCMMIWIKIIQVYFFIFMKFYIFIMIMIFWRIRGFIWVIFSSLFLNFWIFLIIMAIVLSWIFITVFIFDNGGTSGFCIVSDLF